MRPKVIEYVQNKYGKNAVCGIMTVNAQAPRGAIRIAAKYYGASTGKGEKEFLSLGDRIAKAVPKEPGTSFSTVSPDGKTTVKDALFAEFEDEDSRKIIEWACDIEGVFTAYGAHAAGIVISDNDDVKEYVPLRWNDKLSEWTTQCDMGRVETLGLLKMDFLGLKTLDIITKTLEHIKKRTGKVIDPLTLDIEDGDVYREIFQKGKTNSVFQFESNGMKNMLKRFRPETFEDLIILVSMFRPGPLQFIDGVIDVKNGTKLATYITKELEPILGKTYGGIVYQEQVMEIFQKLAGYTLGGADQVRRYMSKKKADKLAKERIAFIDGDASRGIKGCVANGIDASAADKLFDQMSEFAKYAFNKSHAAAYAYNSYITAWLKYHYPAEFLAAAMDWADKDSIPGLMNEAKEFGVEVLAPDINRSDKGFVVENGKILFGLSAVKAVGKSAEEIIEEREKNGPYGSLQRFFERTNVKKNAVINLIKAGAFDAFNPNRNEMASKVDTYKTFTSKIKEKKEFIASASKCLPFIDGCDSERAVCDMQKKLGVTPVLDKPTTAAKLEKRIASAVEAVEMLSDEMGLETLLKGGKEDKDVRMREEKEFLGAYVTAHPLDDYEAPGFYDATPIGDIFEGSKKIFGIIDSVEKKKTKKGQKMAFVNVEDRSGSVRVVIFPSAYEKLGDRLTEGSVFVFCGKCQEEESLTADENGEYRKEYTFILDSLEKAGKKLEPYVLTVSSYPVFHADKENGFRSLYEMKDGHELIVNDMMSNGVFRKMRYKVSDEALMYPGVKAYSDRRS